MTLHDSLLDGSIDATAAVGYLEWTLEFHNAGRRPCEARTEILLPPGAVVSRLTLWIDGQEREAAFGRRQQVREAYESVVMRRRDPVLVTTSGPDRVRLQCFPVPSGGTMKTRLGITCPLSVVSKTQAVLVLPRFSGQNFTIGNNTEQSIWIESHSPIHSDLDAINQEHPKDDLFALRGSVPHRQSTESAVQITALRAPDIREAWTNDELGNGAFVVRQTLTQTTAWPPGRVVFVVDGSAAMAEHLGDIADALVAMPPGIESCLIVAGDDVTEPVPVAGESHTPYRVIAEHVRALQVAGGCDNLPALIRAWDVAAEVPDGVVVWLHAAGPILLGQIGPLSRRWHRRTDGPLLYDVQVDGGPNRIATRLHGEQAYVSVNLLGSAAENLKYLLEGWHADSTKWCAVRTRCPKREVVLANNSKQTSTHLARLWAADEVQSLLETHDDTSTDQATELACRYQLVTPVSGAVVLENAAQYAAANLEPVDGNTVPTIPEPGFYLLAAVVMLVLLHSIRRRKVACAVA